MRRGPGITAVKLMPRCTSVAGLNQFVLRQSPTLPERFARKVMVEACGLRRPTVASGLFDWPRTCDEDVHESSSALLPVRTRRHVGDADERAE